MAKQCSTYVTSFIAAIVAATFGVEPISSWGDHGHMLLAMVAKLSLEDDEVRKIESYLSYWADDFPTMSDFVTSSVWLDHIDCAKDLIQCKSMKAFEDIQIFGPLHYSTGPYNPQNIPIKDIYYYTGRNTGAVWALQAIWDFLTSATIEGEPSELKECNARNGDTQGCKRKTRSRRRGRQAPVVPTGVGSPFSMSFHLRLLLHIYGDLHQPLHNISTFAKGLPKGDFGGNAMKCTWTDARGRNSAASLHHIWDSMGSASSRKFFQIDEDILEAEAKKLMRLHTWNSFGHRVEDDLAGENFEAISKESREVAIKFAYMEFDWKTFCKSSSIPYHPSSAYLEKVQFLTREQLILGGYRLSNLLKKVASLLPTPDDA